MKIELTKEVGIKNGRFGENIGDPDIWFWVRAYGDNDVKTISECFRDESEAIKFYDGLVRHHSQFNTYSPVIEILKSETI